MNEALTPDAPRVMPVESKETCGSCKHGCAATMNFKDPLECRRFPPSVSQFVMGVTNGQPNMMRATAYPQVPRLGPPCGEWVPKFEKQN